ncbi:hypothetical protein HDU80_002857 [Chytriomyces hyalinus]|nr:hypothetical protein HDU80_002857 [Chytriomyces hyalinus]
MSLTKESLGHSKYPQKPDNLHTAIHQMFHLNAAISCLFHITENGARAQPTEIGDFIDRAEYYVLTALDQYEKFTDMDTFFATLKEDQALEPDEIEAIRAIFLTQKIRFRQLMAVGDLAITDENLNQDGIKERGLRTAILSAIRSNFGLKFHPSDARKQ